MTQQRPLYFSMCITSLVFLNTCATTPKAPVTQPVSAMKSSPSESSAPVAKLHLPPLTLTLPTLEKRNRYDLWHLQEKNKESFFLTLICPMGALTDTPSLEGRAFMTLQLMQRSTVTRKREQLIQAIDGKNASLSAHVQMENSGYSLTGAVRDFNPLLETLNEIITQPRMAPNDFKYLGDLIWSQHINELSQPEALAVHASTFHFFSGRERYPVTGTPQSIRTIQLEDVLAFYQMWVGCPRWTIGVVSPWSSVEIEERITKYFSFINKNTQTTPLKLMPSPTNVAIQTPPTFHFVERDDLSQAHIHIRQLALPRNHPDYLMAYLANENFGGTFTSLLNNTLREREQLTYGIASIMSATRYYGELHIHFKTRFDAAEKALTRTLQLWNQFAQHGPETHAFTRMQNQFAGLYSFHYENASSLLLEAMSYDWLGIPMKYVLEIPGLVEKAERPTVTQAFQKHISAKNYFVTVVGPPSIKSALKSWARENRLNFTTSTLKDYLGEFPFQNSHE